MVGQVSSKAAGAQTHKRKVAMACFAEKRNLLAVCSLKRHLSTLATKECLSCPAVAVSSEVMHSKIMKLVHLPSLLLNRVVVRVDLRTYSMMKMRTIISRKLRNLLNLWVDPSLQGLEVNQEAGCSLLMTMMKMINPAL
jgi:hypothetical protein